MLTFKEFIQEKIVEVSGKNKNEPNTSVHHNPHNTIVKNLKDKHSTLRGTYDNKNGVFIWPAYDYNHQDMRKKLKKQQGFEVSDSDRNSSPNHIDFKIHHDDTLEFDKNHPDTSKLENHKSLKGFKYKERKSILG